ncbi:MAG TPA: 50S ribosomal protein L11 methyltransferase [Baekduia sp.]|nr:50S ribosomal protein L11 methyltransferase [Baekduia sp.]
MIRLALRVRPGAAELVLAELLVFAPNGVEQVDGEDYVEYAFYGAGDALPEPDELRAIAGEALVDVVTTEVADDWADRWRAFHRPLDIGRLHLRGPWEPAPPPEMIDVVIDPGQAFGTGAHDTTRLCLELLSELEPEGAFMDLGSGSGVLAVAAAKLGFGPVAGVDHEVESVRATLENAAANGVEVATARFDLLRDGPAPSAPTVAANILRPILLAVARAGFAGAVPERMIVSGLLVHEVDEIATAFARHGLVESERRVTDQWAAALLIA